MHVTNQLRGGVWLLTLVVLLLALAVWWPATRHLTPYTVFPLFGLIAFSFMWVHFVAEAVRRYLDTPRDTLRRHFQITSYIVLFCILAHPLILETKLFVDGFGLPHQSLPAVYTQAIERVAILAGITALICFLAFEFHRLYKDRAWWRYVEWANLIAMLLIIWHGFTLGGAFRQPWFQVIWAGYAVTFVAAVTYSEYHKRRTLHGNN